MQYDVQLYIGHNINDTPALSQEEIMRACAEFTTGATAIPARGMWHGVAENTTIVEICAVSGEFVEKLRAEWIPFLCVALQQDAIMLRVSVSNCEFIGKDGE